MSRPKTKGELINASSANFKNLGVYIENLEANILSQNFETAGLNQNIRDVISHLYHWHKLFLQWYSEGMNGQKPEMPAKGYKWKDVPALNKKIWSIYQDNTLEEVVSLLEGSHNEIYKIIEQHTDRELFEKQKYAWTGSTSLGSYLISASSSHYAWALKYIRKHTSSR